jgi:hypothetical protein
VRAANSGDLQSQDQVGYFHFMSAMRLDMVQGAPADAHVVTARWAEALRFVEMPAERGAASAQARFIAVRYTPPVGGAFHRTGPPPRSGGARQPKPEICVRSGSSGYATTTGEVWSETLHMRRLGSERPRSKDILRLPKLYRGVSRDISVFEV